MMDDNQNKKTSENTIKSTDPGSKSKMSKPKTSKLGSARGIESLFRNSYRAQLDMITLAATKANIMISLNGLLVSVLLVSGVYFLDSEPLFILPFIAFLSTCTIAVVFAVLAARPLMDRSKPSFEDFRADKADLLIFEQFATLPKDQYIDAMLEMVSDKNRIYRNMIVHLHDMGRSAERSFHQLNISYSSFMIGLVISVILLFGVIVRSFLSPT